MLFVTEFDFLHTAFGLFVFKARAIYNILQFSFPQIYFHVDYYGESYGLDDG